MTRYGANLAVEHREAERHPGRLLAGELGHCRGEESRLEDGAAGGGEPERRESGVRVRAGGCVRRARNARLFWWVRIHSDLVHATSIYQ